MPAPRKNDIERIESDRYRLGYARAIKGQYVIFISTKKIYTGMKPVPQNIPAVKRMIDAEVERRMNLQATGQDLAYNEAPSLYGAADRWYAEFVEDNPRVGKSARKTYTGAIAAFSKKTGLADMPLGTAPGVVPSLVDRFARVKASRTGSSQTTRQYLSVWSRIFTWSEKMGWIARNPLKLMVTPKVRKKRDDEKRYTPEEYGLIMCRSYRKDPELYRLCLWLSLTGMRVQEALDMRWRDIGEKGFEIMGKGHAGEKLHRFFPLKRYPDADRSPIAVWQRRLHRVLIAQQAKAAERGDLNYVWRWRTSRTPSAWLKTIKSDAGIPFSEGRAFHVFRSMAGHYMKWTLRLPKDFVLRMCGHSEEVHDRNYAMAAATDEMAAVLDLTKNANGPS